MIIHSVDKRERTISYPGLLRTKQERSTGPSHSRAIETDSLSLSNGPSQSSHSSSRYLLSVYYVPERGRAKGVKKGQSPPKEASVRCKSVFHTMSLSQWNTSVSQNLGHYTASSGVLGAVPDPEESLRNFEIRSPGRAINKHYSAN